MDSQSPANILIGEGIQVSILGMVIVFMVLILLWFTLEIMNAIFNKKTKDEGQGKIASAPSVQPAPAVPDIARASTVVAADDNVIAAVCAAAVATILGSSGFVIRSIKRQSGWNER